MDVEHEIKRTAQELTIRSNGSRPAPEPTQGARHDFVSLGSKVAQAMVQAAEDQVTQAQNKLKEIQAWADNLTQEVRTKDQELAEMTDRIRDFGETVLEANRKFHATVGSLTESPRGR